MNNLLAYVSEINNLKTQRVIANKQIAELQEKLSSEQKFSAGLQGELKIAEDKLHRRNLQIADLKKESVKSNSVATEILITAIRWLKGQEVNNPFKGCQGIDCDEVSKAINAVNKVCSI